MNQDWADHLLTRIADLERRLQQERKRRVYQKRRADTWRSRALSITQAPVEAEAISTRQCRPLDARRWRAGQREAQL